MKRAGVADQEDPEPGRGASGDHEALSVRPSPVNDLAAALRRVIDAAVGRRLPDEALAEAAQGVAEVARRLEAAAAPGKAPRGAPDRTGPPQDYFPTSPVIGFANPLAPPAEVWAVAGAAGVPELRGRVTFGYAYEGPPTCVHGGVIAELFDELLGTTNILTGHAGMTGTLKVRFHKPTPLLTPLDLEARLEGVEGRKISVAGAIRHDGQVTAEAHGLFIEAGPTKMLEIAEANAQAAGAAVLDQEMAAALRSGGQMARSRPSQ